ncbi:MAG: DUF420 domain-containing protein [bacterium]
MEFFLSLLPHLNAVCNGASALLVVTGIYFVRNGRVKSHRNSMLGAVGASALFLVGYLTRYFLEGTHVFPGEGIMAWFYYPILISHMFLAMLVPPLVLWLIYLAFTDQFKRHARWARRVYPIWIYVSVTGIIVYVFLYQIYSV